jgi:NAD(P)-dependent dehydrogenase (short-subunit alcohol dehydrogenase family)
MFRLDGKIALITGSGGGLGVGIARALASQGAAAVINDLDAARAGSTAAALRADGYQAHAIPFDVTDLAGVETGIDRIGREIGPIDILVNNAGNAGGDVFQQLPFAEMPPAAWDRWIDVNLKGVLNCTHAVIKGMCDRGWGRVITISSTAGRVGTSIRTSVYGASKAGAAHFMRHLSQEVAGHGITANVIALGYMSTVNEEYEKTVIPLIPAGRCGTGADAGAAAVYLASQEASWVTGATLVVDGGLTPF